MENRQPEDLRHAMVVTGATGGIGKAIIEAVYARCHPVTIIGACRTPANLEPFCCEMARRYPGSAATIVPAWTDLATNEMARRSADGIAALLSAQNLALSAIVNNAGTMPINRLELNPEGREITLQVNCIGTLAFTLRLLPQMHRGGVVVFTSSVMRKFPRALPDFEMKALCASSPLGRFMNYGRSKLLLTLAARRLAVELQSRDIRVNCADPGVVDSGIIRLGYGWVDDIADTVARPLMRTPAQGAKAALLALGADATAMMATASAMKPLPPLSATDQEIVAKVMAMAQSR